MRFTPLLGATALLALSACGDSSPDTASTAATTADGSAAVVAGFYPLAYVAERVGGGLIDVVNLTPPGVEPHHLELTARDTAAVQDADLVVLLAGFSPALDDAVQAVAGDHAFDVSSAARLDDHDADDHDADDEHEHDADDHDDHHDADDHDADDHDDHHDADDGHDHGGSDPHFWLDPTRLADVAEAVAVRLGEVVPSGAATFTANAAELRGELAALDAEFATALADCASDDLVTSHTAFGYLAERYGFEQVGIVGVTPEQEPSPAALAAVTDFVREHGVTTIYTETLVDPAIAETIASETGAATAVLDPLEGLTDESAGDDYFAVMRANLASLVAGQGCR